MKRQTRGWGAYIAVVLVLVLLFMYLPGIMTRRMRYPTRYSGKLWKKTRLPGLPLSRIKKCPPVP